MECRQRQGLHSGELCRSDSIREDDGNCLLCRSSADIFGSPKTPLELEALAWAVQQPFYPDVPAEEALTYAQESAFNLPYEQGPGGTLIHFERFERELLPCPHENCPVGLDSGADMSALCDYVSEDEAQFIPKPGDMEDGWVEMDMTMTFLYTDSMTNVFVSPIYTRRSRPGPHGINEFAIGEM